MINRNRWERFAPSTEACHSWSQVYISGVPQIFGVCMVSASSMALFSVPQLFTWPWKLFIGITLYVILLETLDWLHSHLFERCGIWYFWRPDASDRRGVKGYGAFVFVRPLDKQEVTLDASRGTSHGTLLLPLAQIWTDREVYIFFVHGGRFCKSCV